MREEIFFGNIGVTERAMEDHLNSLYISTHTKYFWHSHNLSSKTCISSYSREQGSNFKGYPRMTTPNRLNNSSSHPLQTIKALRVPTNRNPETLRG